VYYGDGFDMCVYIECDSLGAGMYSSRVPVVGSTLYASERLKHVLSSSSFTRRRS